MSMTLTFVDKDNNLIDTETNVNMSNYNACRVLDDMGVDKGGDFYDCEPGHLFNKCIEYLKEGNPSDPSEIPYRYSRVAAIMASIREAVSKEAVECYWI